MSRADLRLNFRARAAGANRRRRLQGANRKAVSDWPSALADPAMRSAAPALARAENRPTPMRSSAVTTLRASAAGAISAWSYLSARPPCWLTRVRAFALSTSRAWLDPIRATTPSGPHCDSCRGSIDQPLRTVWGMTSAIRLCDGGGVVGETGRFWALGQFTPPITDGETFREAYGRGRPASPSPQARDGQWLARTSARI